MEEPCTLLHNRTYGNAAVGRWMNWKMHWYRTTWKEQNGVCWNVRKAVDSRHSVVVHGSLVSVHSNADMLLEGWSQDTKRSTLMHTHAQTNNQTNWEEGLRASIHVANLTHLWGFRCCDNSVPFCVHECWQQNRTKKWIFKNWMHISDLSLFLPVPAHRAYLECLVELASLDLLERRFHFPLANTKHLFLCMSVFLSYWICNFFLFTRVTMVKLETLG